MLKENLKSRRGFTLVELVVVMAISAIVFTAMVVTYAEGVKYTRKNSSIMTMYNEGSAALDLMASAIRNAGRVRIRPHGGVSNAKMELAYPTDWGGGSIDFYFDKISKVVKWSNRARDNSKLHMTLLPMLDIETPANEEPYLKVKDLRFNPQDHIGPPSPYLEGYKLVKIELVLEDDQGDTLYLSTVSSKRNDY